MPTFTFIPQNVSIDVEENVKLLVAARRARVPIRFGCAACSCGTCAVAVKPSDKDGLTPMRDNEKNLLNRMKLPIDGSVRLSCQARIQSGTCVVDLDFQETYSPDQGDDENASS